jgi:hypothetical protein
MLFAVRLVSRCDSSLVLDVMRDLFLACMVDGRALGDAFVVTAPGDDCAFGQVQDAFDGFTV